MDEIIYQAFIIALVLTAIFGLAIVITKIVYEHHKNDQD